MKSTQRLFPIIKIKFIGAYRQIIDENRSSMFLNTTLLAAV